MYDTVIDLETIEGISVASIGNEVDLANADVIRRYLDEIVGTQTTLVVSLASCRYIDSSGLRPIIALAERLGSGFAVVVPLGTHIRRIFDITALHKSMAVYATLDEALANVTKGLAAA